MRRLTRHYPHSRRLVSCFQRLFPPPFSCRLVLRLALLSHLHSTSGSSNATLNGQFEFNTRAMGLGLIIIVAVLAMLIFAVVSSRSRHQDQRRLKMSTETVDHEPAQEASKSPVQTGAPLNSHSLPPNVQSDGDDSDGPDGDRFLPPQSILLNY